MEEDQSQERFTDCVIKIKYFCVFLRQQSIVTDGLVKIQVPDEKYDNIWTQMLPFLPNSTTAEMCKHLS